MKNLLPCLAPIVCECVYLLLSRQVAGAAGAFVNFGSLSLCRRNAPKIALHTKALRARDRAGVVIKGGQNHYAGTNSRGTEYEMSVVITFHFSDSIYNSLIRFFI
jgi:hypothetical protein